jgi:hypothetical protein
MLTYKKGRRCSHTSKDDDKNDSKISPLYARIIEQGVIEGFFYTNFPLETEEISS